MSYSIDVNVLVYSSNSGATEHETAKLFLERCAQQSEVLCLAWVTVMSYLRISTHPRIFQTPLSPEQALINIESLMALPHVRPIGEQDNFLTHWRKEMPAVPSRGNLVPDTHLAIVLKQNGVRTLYTRDRDFLKYPFLSVKDPFAQSAS